MEPKAHISDKGMKQMTFLVDTCSKAASRLGHLELQRPSGGLNTYASPMFFVHTLGGSVPHVTSEVFDLIFADQECKPPVQISIDTTYTFHETLSLSGMSISKFVGLHDSPCLLTVLNPAENFLTGFNDKHGVSIWPRVGRRTLNLKTFSKIVEDFQPSVYQCINDYDVNSRTMEKRLKKSTSRSVEYLNEVIANLKGSKSSLWVPIEPAWFLVNEKEGEQALSYLLENRNEFEGIFVKRNYDEPVDFLESFRKISQKLPADKMRYVSGVCTLNEVIDLVLEGVDAFDSSIITQLSEVKKALVLPLMQNKPVVNECIPTLNTNNANDDPDNKLVLDLKDTKYFEDLNPLSLDCSCYTCRRHTRSYIHHLHVTNEMLVYVLLMIHNMASFNNFFKTLRSCLASEDGSTLEALRSLVKDADFELLKVET